MFVLINQFKYDKHEIHRPCGFTDEISEFFVLFYILIFTGLHNNTLDKVSLSSLIKRNILKNVKGPRTEP